MDNSHSHVSADIVDALAKTIWLAGFERAFSRTPTDPWENQAESAKAPHIYVARKVIHAGFVTDAPAQTAEDEKSPWPVEVWHGDRKVSIYSNSVLRVWGPNMDTHMTDEPRTHETVAAAMDWLYAARSSAESAREAALEAAARDFIAKVDRGEARSKRSYSAFKAALDMPVQPQGARKP